MFGSPNGLKATRHALNIHFCLMESLKISTMVQDRKHDCAKHVLKRGKCKSDIMDLIELHTLGWPTKQETCSLVFFLSSSVSRIFLCLALAALTFLWSLIPVQIIIFLSIFICLSWSAVWTLSLAQSRNEGCLCNPMHSLNPTWNQNVLS